MPLKLLYVATLCLFILGCVITLILGETPWNVIWEGVIQRFRGESMHWNPLLDERLPRLFVLLCTGASLAVSGAVMQALFQNPLASPSVLGISAGGCLAVMPIFVWQLHIHYPFAIPLAAFTGCFCTLFMVYGLSRQYGKVKMDSLILTGIAISTLLLAVQGALLYGLRDNWQLIQLVTEWEAGSTADRSFRHVHMQLPLTLIGLGGCWLYRRELNLLSLGDEEAANLGVEVAPVRWRLFLCVSLLTAGALAAVGVIAFYGLLVPHILRKLLGADCSRLIPSCIVYGALGLCLADSFLRILNIHLLSIGNVSALLGSFFFLFLLLGNRERQNFYA